jgi:hypothetical protein
VSFRCAFFRTQDQAHRRVFSLFHPMLACVIQVEVHLSGICIAKLADFEINDNQAVEPTVEKEQIDPKPSVVNTKPPLPTQESEVVT